MDKNREVDEILSKVDSTTFEEDDWNVVVVECSPLASKWQLLSAFLGLKFSLIDRISSDFPNDSLGCWSQALKEWIRQIYNTEKFHEPSWRTLLKAVARVDKAMFRILASEHQSTCDTVHFSDTIQSATKPNSGLATAQPQATALSVQEHQLEEESSPTEGDTNKSKGVHQPASGSVATTAESHPTTPAIPLEQKEQLYEKRCFESEHMIYKFQELFTATKKSLREEKVSAEELVGHLECLGSIKPTYKDIGQTPLRHQLPGLADAKTVNAVMSVVKDYCSFFNYHMLEHIIDEFGTKQDKQNLACYKEDFNKYAESCITQCPSEVGKISEEGHANLFVTLDDSFDNCSVSHLNVFCGNLWKILNIPSNVTLRLCRINLGSIKLIFQIPHFVQQAIFPLSSDQKAELSSLGVVQLSCGDYQFTRQETKEGVEEPVSDGDSDHTDSEGSVDSNNTCDAELSSMAAGLALGKPGDTFSVSADSALGRSSVITGTTAGVTQFSEDLFGRELCDLADMGMGHGVAGGSSENELHQASARGDLGVVKRLVEEKQLNPLQKVGKLGVNALHIAARYGQLEVLGYFIEERGCNPASQEDQAMTPLHYAAAFKHLDIVRYLVAKQQMDPLCCADDGTTPLHMASQEGDINILRYLVNELRKFLPLNDIVTSRGKDGLAPIHFAALCGHLQIVQYFIAELNCDPNIATPVVHQGRTTRVGGRIALHLAAEGGHLQIIKHLVEQCNCNPSHLDYMRATPLHSAAANGHLNVVEYLTLEQQCEPMCTNKYNFTPLHDAALRGELEVIKFYIETLHCSSDVRGQHNHTPLVMARSQGHHHVVEYLESIHPKLK